MSAAKHVLAGLAWLSLGSSAIALAGCGAKAADGPPPPAEVTVANPLVQPVAEWTEHTGRFVALQTVDVRPRVSGYLQQVHFHDGEYVRQGQLLFTIDPLPLQAKYDRSKAEAAQADAHLLRAQSEFHRAEALKKVEAISTEEFEARREAVAQAAAAREAAQAALRSDGLDLGYTRVYAPISGRISDRRVDAGNLVQGGETVLTQIVSQDPINFEFAAPESLLSAPEPPKAGQQVSIKLEGEADYLHHGRLDFIDNRIDAATGTIRGRAVFRNEAGAFTPGQYGRLRVMAPSAPNAVLLPDAAVNSDQSRKYVLVVNAKNLVEYRPVTLGPVVGGLRIIREGLSGSDRVVINGAQRAFPGQPVKPRTGRIAAAATNAAG